MNVDLAAAVMIGLVVTYPVLMWILALIAQPVRRRLADVGSELLASRFLKPDDKTRIEGIMDDPYDWRVMWVFAFVLPQLVLVRAFRKKASWERVTDPSFRAKFDEFMTCFLKATAAASPVATLIVMIEIALIGAILWPLGLLRRLSDVQFRALMAADSRLNHSR